jgi:Fungal MACPF-like domain
MTTTALGTTPLDKALAAAGLGAYSGAFDKAGYTDWDSLGSDKASMEKAVAAVIPPSEPGVVNRIVTLWENATSHGSLPLLEGSDLKAGDELDLAGMTVTVNGAQFAIPTQVAAKTLHEFGPADWVTLAEQTDLLAGLDMNRAFDSSTDDSARAPKLPLVWRVPADNGFVGPSVGTDTSTMSYTASMNNLVQNRLSDVSVDIDTPFVSVSAGVARDEQQASSLDTRMLYTTGQKSFAMAKLTMRDCTELSTAFVLAIDDALAKPDAADQLTALEEVFTDYGQMVPTTITLGGQLYFQFTRSVTGSVSDSDVSETVTAAVGAKYDGIGGGVSGSFKDGSGTETTAQQIVQSSTFTCIGGDVTLLSEPQQWAKSVDDPNTWAVIGRAGMDALVNLLDDNRKNSVLAVWQAGLKQAWGGFDPPADYILPDFDGKPFTVATCPAGGRSTPVYPARSKPASDRMALHVVAGSAATGWVTAEEGTALADPQTNGLLFQLLYTGATSQGPGQGTPLYCLVSQQSDGLYVADVDGSSQLLSCDHAISGWSPSAGQPSKATTSWTLKPADPSGVLGSDYAGTYLIQHFVSGQLLGLVREREHYMDPPSVPPFVVNVDGDPSKLTAADRVKYAWVCTPFDEGS